MSHQKADIHAKAQQWPKQLKTKAMIEARKMTYGKTQTKQKKKDKLTN